MNRQNQKMKPIFLALLLVLLVVAALPLLLRAQSGLGLRWSNVSSGYGVSSGDGYTIAGTGGEVDGGQLYGDGIQVTGGFWSGVEEAPEWIPPTPVPTRQPIANQLYLPSVIDQ